MNKGILYLVSTPIGNLEDITLRAINILKTVDLIAAEDTRRTLQLLNHLGISKPLISCYQHNENQKSNYLIPKILDGLSIALVSDAGTPAISDPGEKIVKLAIENEITVCPIPGPVAAICGLITSGISTGRFTFEGFLPINKRVRKERLRELKFETRTMIFYEAPHKLKYTLKDMCESFGNDRIISISREITKKFEEHKKGTLLKFLDYYNENNPKGEFVLVIEGYSGDVSLERNNFENITIKEHVLNYIAEGLTKKDALKKVAVERNISKKDVYSEMLK